MRRTLHESLLWGRGSLEDGNRSSSIMEIAKNTKKMLRIGKKGGPPVFTDKFKDDLTPLKLNKREKEALNLNYGSLWVAWLLHFIECLLALGKPSWKM